MEEDLTLHPAFTSYITPPVTKPLLESLDTKDAPPEGFSHLHWLLDINDQFFCWELQQVVSICLLRPHHSIYLYLLDMMLK